jgi:hypothetical protein
MKQVFWILYALIFLIDNSFAGMLSVTTGGHIAASSEVEDTIDNQGTTLISSATIQNSKIVGFQESSNITLTTALPSGTTGGNFSLLATDAIAVGTIVNSYIIFLMPRTGESSVDHRDPTITFQFDPGEKVINVYDNAIEDMDDSADTAFEQIEMSGKTYAAMAGVGGAELEAGKDTVAMTTGTDSIGGTVTVGFNAAPTGDFIRVVTQVQTTLSYSENTKSLLRSQSITSRAIIRQSINQVEQRMNFTRNLTKNISHQNIKFGIITNNNEASGIINNLSNKTLNHSGKWFENFAVWTSGSIATAKVEKTKNILGENIFNNNAVTIGIDTKTKKNNTFGFAFTQIHRDTEIGNDIIYIDTVAHNITTYANIKLNEKQWFDILLGGGDIENDIARHLSTTVNTANRNGYQVFGSLKYTTNELFNNDNKKSIDSFFYSKVDLDFTSLNAYREKGSVSVLVFNKQYVKNATLALGSTLSKSYFLKSHNLQTQGQLTPFINFELGKNLTSNSTNESFYTNNTTVNTYKVEGNDSEYQRLGLGFNGNLFDNIQISLSADYYREKDSITENNEKTFNFTIKKVLH